MKRHLSIISLAAAALLLAGCSTPAQPAPAETPKSETQKESEAIPKSERGNIVKKVGELAELKDADGNLVASLKITNITVDLPCTEEFASAPENGHIIGVDVEFESTALYEEGTMILGPWGFKAIDSKGVTMNADTQSVGSVGCIPAEQFVNRTPTPGEKINGTIVLDVNDTSGILVFNDMWEWEYPA